MRMILIGALTGALGCQSGPSTAPPPGDADSQQAAPPDHAVVTPPTPVPVQPLGPDQPDVVLLVTGGTHGLMEVCNCSGPMLGGLARRSGLVISYRHSLQRVVLLDTGDFLSPDPEDLRNPSVVQGYRQLGYDVVLLGAHELAMGHERLTPLFAQGPAVLSTTVQPPGEAFEREYHRQWEHEGREIRLAIVSAVAPEALHFLPRAVAEALRTDGLESVTDRVRSLRDQGHTVVLIAHGPERFAQAAARAGADVVIRGQAQRPTEHVDPSHGTPIVSVGGSGHVGVIALRLTPQGRVGQLDWRVEEVDLRWPMDNRLMQTYQAYAHRAMRHALDIAKPQGLAYVASATCAECHPQHYDAWRDSPHARAYQSLERVERTFDPSCLMCHTSGFATADGFHTIQQTPHLAGVNCQDCHRFELDEHVQTPQAFPRPDPLTCTTCHTPITDPDFDYPTRLRQLPPPCGR